MPWMVLRTDYHDRQTGSPRPRTGPIEMHPAIMRVCTTKVAELTRSGRSEWVVCSYPSEDHSELPRLRVQNRPVLCNREAEWVCHSDEAVRLKYRPDLQTIIPCARPRREPGSGSRPLLLPLSGTLRL